MYIPANKHGEQNTGNTRFPADSPQLKPRPVHRRCHRLPVQPASLPSTAALPEVLRRRRPVLARPAAVAAGPKREAHVVAVRVGAVPVVGPPVAVAIGSASAGGNGTHAPVRGLRRTLSGRSRGRGYNHSWVAGASDLCGPATLLVSITRGVWTGVVCVEGDNEDGDGESGSK